MTGDLLLSITLKATLVVTVAWGVVSLYRPTTAASRHLVLTAALIIAVGLPLAAIYAPAWRVAVLPSTWHLPGAEELTSSPVVTVPSTIETHHTAAITAETGAGPTQTQQFSRAMRGWRHAPVLIWWLGLWIGMARLAASFLWGARVTHRASRVIDPAWLALARQTETRLQLPRHVDMRVTDRIDVPAVYGVIWPTLLLPRTATDWNRPLRQSVLLHELAHVKRQDCLVQVLAQIGCCLHWFNPFVRMTVRRLRTEQERACDAMVLAAGVDAPDYAEHLCAIAREGRGRTRQSAVMPSMTTHAKLEMRVRAILATPREGEGPSRAWRAAAGAAACVLLVPLGGLKLSAFAAGGPPTGALSQGSQVLTRRGVEPPSLAQADDRDRGMSPVARRDQSMAGRPAPSHVRRIWGTTSDRLAEGTLVDFSGTWTLVESRGGVSGGPDQSAPPGGTLVIRQTADAVRFETTRQSATDRLSSHLDGRMVRYVDQRRRVGGGTSVRGRDVTSRWDGPKLVTLIRPFSEWQPEDDSGGALPSGSGVESVYVRSLSNDGLEMTVERVSRHDWGWEFEGKEPSPAYARTTDIYKRVGP